ncbi:hypothetical protein BCR39DRAFT_542271 [Naematelia encephala]|uniref:Zn(2)-C6 fungal-type domain-containing protein n=1 Tax=Naematelia encephala TaxID=71784 RepID=A0A1Y2AUZ2_9TREE|nr:hypothetical protein BCR39DRAFT_542271 [Naematelia encephala]
MSSPYSAPNNKIESVTTRQRQRAPVSCVQCARKKIKCDRTQPCSPCRMRNQTDSCSYVSSSATLHKTVVASERPISQHRLVPTEHRLDPDVERSISEEVPQGEHRPLPDVRRQHAGDTVVAHLEDFMTSGSMAEKLGFSSPTPMGHDNLSSNVIPNIPPGVIAEYPSIRRLVVPAISAMYEPLFGAVLDTLPADAQLLEVGIARYFSHAAWECPIIHQTVFMQEYHAFRLLVGLGHRSHIDPLWVAVLFMMLAMAFDTYERVEQIAEVSTDVPDFVALSDTLRRSACAALECGDWMGRPKVRTVQVSATVMRLITEALVLLISHLLFDPSPGAVDRGDKYTACAVFTCHRLGWHRFNDDPTYAPGSASFEDLALVDASPIYLRHQALLLLHAALTVSNENHRNPPAFELENVTSPLPDNLDFNQLFLDQQDLPQPLPYFSDASIINLLYQRSAITRRQSQLNRQGRMPSWRDLSDLDSRLMSLVRRYDLDSASPTEAVSHSWARLSALHHICTKRILLFRPCLGSVNAGSLPPDQMDKIRDVLHAAARTLLQCAMRLHELGAPLIRGCFHLMHVQSALFVLFRLSWAESTLDTVDSQLIAAVTGLFDSYTESVRPHIRHAAFVAHTTARLLSETFLTRTRFLGSDESFTHALERIRHVVKRQEDQRRKLSVSASTNDFGELLNQLLEDASGTNDVWFSPSSAEVLLSASLPMEWRS